MSIGTRLVRNAAALAVAGVVVLGTASAASAAPGAPYLGYGHTTSGNGVWCVQHNINFLVNQLYAQGTITTPPPYRTLAEDRAWGPKTDANVRWFQKMVRVDQDGVVGPATGSRLLTLGDQGYNGSSLSGRGYCWNYLPGDFD
ncbi:peptidoglycan-binding protein [Streptomyces sp. NPDC059456]|uniref:peptidoglycan-binding domain-containing protein n=1 Tax=Streptomyces sp. NPDC059456 TaxID=3346838 RepID=UPI0036A85406